jgi:TonB family protein
VRCATVLCVTLLMVAAKAPHASALPLLIPLLERDRKQSGSPDDSRGQNVSTHHAVAPRPNPDTAGKYHVGDGVSPPRLVYAPAPEFTDKARRKKLGGSLVVSLTVNAAGKPQDVRASRSLAEGVGKKLRPNALGLDENAVKAVEEYRFEPAEFQGKPVPVETTVEVNYRIF